MVRSAAVLLAVAGLSGAVDPAHGAAPAAGNCGAAVYRQLDFWIGEWRVLHADGRHAGDNRIASVAGGCGLYESWTGEGGIAGHSLTFYDGQQRKWRQQWVDNTGASLTLIGAQVGKSIVLQGEAPELTGKQLQRLTFTPLAAGGLRQLWETSADGGKHWTAEFDGRYVRK